MPKARSFAPARRKAAQPSRLPKSVSKAVAGPAGPQLQQQAPAPQMMLDLQRLAGNRAAGGMVTKQFGSPGAQSRPVGIQRLVPTKAEFKKQTDAGFLSGRGKTMKQLDSLLEEYHSIRADGKHLHPGPQQERCVNILHEIIEDATIWINNHRGDESRSKRRLPGLTSLMVEAGKELRSLESLRNEGQKLMGQKIEPVTRTQNVFKTQMEGSFTSIFTKVAPILSAAAPSTGDTAEVEIQVKIPCEPSGVGYLGFRLKAQVERLKKQAMKVRFELAFVGGAKIANVAEVGGELGMYMESQGGSPQKAMELLSYGLYRRVRESSVIPRELGNFLWGGSGTGVGWNRAEKWAAQVEKENFKNKSSFTNVADSDEAGAYVETGGLAGAKAKGGVGGVAELEGGLKYSTGQRYDHTSVENLKKKGGGKLGEAMPVPTVRGAQQKLGESVHHLEAGLSAKGGPFSGALKVAVDWATKNRNEGTAYLQSVKVGLEASATLPMTELVAGGLGGYVVPLAASVAKGIRAVTLNASQDKRSTGQNVGDIIGVGENGATAITQIAQVPKEAFTPKFEFDINQAPPGFALPVELKLSVTGGYDFFEKKWMFEVKLEYIKGIDVNAGVFEMKVRKGERVLRVFYDGDGWGAD